MESSFRRASYQLSGVSNCAAVPASIFSGEIIVTLTEKTE